MRADASLAFDVMCGPIADEEVGAERETEFEVIFGSDLLGLCASWEDAQKTRLALTQRGVDPDLVKAVESVEKRLAARIKKAVAQHPLGPWLAEHPGVGGVHTARILAMIGDPWRFPGQRCTNGHYSRPGAALSSIEEVACEVVTVDGPCGGTMLPPRPGTGTRSLWHYFGLHVVDGRAPRRTKGQQSDWNTKGKTALLMPGGIAEQIVRLRVQPWREVYDTTKARLTAERGADGTRESVRSVGAEAVLVSGSHRGATDGAEADAGDVGGSVTGLRPIQVEGIARKVAAKAFLGDLLAEWKRRDPLECIAGSEKVDGWVAS
jgi:hypothetical protein